MAKAKKGGNDTKLRKLRSIRLVLIIIAVVLAAAMVAVQLLWIPAAVEPVEVPRDNNGVSSLQPGQADPGQSTNPEAVNPDDDSNISPNLPDALDRLEPNPAEGAPEAGKSQGGAVHGGSSNNDEDYSSGNPAGTGGGNEDTVIPPEGPDAGESDEDKSETDQSGEDKSETDQSGEDKTETDQFGEDKTDTDQSDEDKSGTDESDEDKSDTTKSDTDKSDGDDSDTGTATTNAASPNTTTAEASNTRYVQQTVTDTGNSGAATDGDSGAQADPVGSPANTEASKTNGAAKASGNPAGEPEDDSVSAATITMWVLAILLVADIAAITVITVMIEKRKEYCATVVFPSTPTATITTETQVPKNAAAPAAGEIRVGQLHNIGARPYQEDSSGVTALDDGILAVVADGMGGLSGGDKVSQKIVYTMLGYSDRLRPGYMDGALERMVNATNETVNRMLGPEGLYKSGSTLLAVLVRQRRFHWIAVGDSHIYYYHNGKLSQVNEEHNRGQELLHKAARGEISYEEARKDPKKNGLTSFIGMGRLKYIDKSVESIPLVPGDRILLMTDGVFNALPDQTIQAVLERNPDVQAAAAEMERLVIQKANPRQDNFTAVILGF